MKKLEVQVLLLLDDVHFPVAIVQYKNFGIGDIEVETSMM